MDSNNVVVHNYDRSFLRIVGEAFVGSGVGFFLSFPPMAAISAVNDYQVSDFTLAFFYSSYILGASVGVYVIAQNGNKDLSFLNTLGYGALGGLIAVTPLLFNVIDESGITYFSLPLLGALIYANMIAPFPVPTEKT